MQLCLDCQALKKMKEFVNVSFVLNFLSAWLYMLHYNWLRKLNWKFYVIRAGPKHFGALGGIVKWESWDYV